MTNPERYAVVPDNESLWKKSNTFKVGVIVTGLSIFSPVLLGPGLILMGGPAAWHHEKNPFKGKG